MKKNLALLLVFSLFFSPMGLAELAIESTGIENAEIGVVQEDSLDLIIDSAELDALEEIALPDLETSTSIVQDIGEALPEADGTDINEAEEYEGTNENQSAGNEHAPAVKDSYNGQSYWLFNEKVSPLDADSYCRQLGGAPGNDHLTAGMCLFEWGV